MAKAVKLSDIGQKLGISTVSVSKALSNQKGVSEELRDKIKKVAYEMGYIKSVTSDKQPETRSYNIGVLMLDIFLDKYASFYWQFYQDITTKAVSKGCFTLLEVINSQDEAAGIMPKIIQEKKVDGIIIIGGMQAPYLELLHEKSNMPIIYLDYYNAKCASDAVVSNNYYGTYALTNYLFEMGHSKIGFVGTVLATESITDRYFGYQKSVLENNGESKPEWVIEDRDINSGYIDYVNKLQLPKEMPTAFVCNCDLTASYLIKKLREKGYKVPEDVSVVGFDNYLYPGLSDIGITTYEVDMKEMARTTVLNMIKKITNSSYKLGIVIVEGHLVYKESVSKR